MDRLSEVVGHHVQCAATAWDRIVRNGDRDRLPRPAQVIPCFRDVVGVPSVTPAGVMRRTAP